MRPLRTFIAVVASPEVRAAARKVAQQLAPVAHDVRWVVDDNLHWTLQFLGDIETLEIPAVCNAVTQGVREIPAFELEVRGAGAFPAADRPRTLWLGAGTGAQSMVALQAGIQRQLDRLGHRGESRRYVPHLTLGRTGGKTPPRSLVRELASLADYDAGTMLVDEVAVFSSKLGPEGPTYDVLAHAQLAT
jgi:2'-5' RNA ligase